MPEIITLKNEQLTAQIALKGAELRAFSFRNTPFCTMQTLSIGTALHPTFFPMSVL